MPATMVLEKSVSISEKSEIRQEEKTVREVCSCGVSHMATHNAVCQACAMKESVTK